MLPVLFTIGAFNVYAFGIFLAMAFILSTFIVWKKAKAELKEEEYLDLYLQANIVALICARASYIIFHVQDFGLNILKYILVREAPGLSLLSGLIGAFIFLAIYTKKKKISLWHLLDLYSLAASFMLVFAKIGEQLGGATYGRPTTFPIGVGIVGKIGRFHPVELYEALFFLLMAIGFSFLYEKIQKNKWPDGLVFYLFVLGISISVLMLEFFKEYAVYLYGLSFRQWFAVILIVVVAKPLFDRITNIRAMNRGIKI